MNSAGQVPEPKRWATLRRATEAPVRVRLLVIPHSGASPDTFRPLVAPLPGDVEVLGLPSPGPERRQAERRQAERRQAGQPGAGALELIDSLKELRRREVVPTVVYGHGSGALLAMRIADYLGTDCCAVVLSGQSPGTCERSSTRPQSDCDILRRLVVGDLMSAGLPEDAVWRQALLDVLRADRVSGPITIIFGRDDLFAAASGPGERQQHTGGSVEVLTLPGGHFAVADGSCRQLVVDALRRASDVVARQLGVGILCLPFAGSGASFYRTWRREAPSGFTVRGLQLPGREDRLVEDPLTDARKAARYLLPQIGKATGECSRVVLFGHSLGAVLAFEVARLMVDRFPGSLMRLVVSGSPSPRHGREQRATGLGDDQFVAGSATSRDIATPSSTIPKMRELLLPALRADVEMHENYRVGVETRLPVPVTVLRGEDDELVSASEAALWQDFSDCELSYAELPGGHMYLLDQSPEILRLIAMAVGASDAVR